MYSGTVGPGTGTIEHSADAISQGRRRALYLAILHSKLVVVCHSRAEERSALPVTFRSSHFVHENLFNIVES
jgi:hypothetical protein